MKKVISLFLLIVTFAFSNGFEANAQTVKRIEFAKGRSSATVKGTTGTSGVYYNLRVKSGQKMTVNLSPARGVGIKVERDGGAEVLLREERGGAYTVYFEDGGEISIFVGSTGGKSVPYALSVSITRMTDI
jgi:hypothetical protein